MVVDDVDAMITLYAGAAAADDYFHDDARGKADCAWYNDCCLPFGVFNIFV